MRVFRDLNFVEHLGMGMKKILSVYDKGIFRISENFVEICFPFAKNRINIEKKEQVKEQVRKIVQIFERTDSEYTLMELMFLLHLKGRRNFVENYLAPSIAAELVEPTQPDSPKSPTQKYKLTEKGIDLKNYLLNETQP